MSDEDKRPWDIAADEILKLINERLEMRARLDQLQMVNTRLRQDRADWSFRAVQFAKEGEDLKSKLEAARVALKRIEQLPAFGPGLDYVIVARDALAALSDAPPVNDSVAEPKTIRVLGAGGDYEDHPNPNYKPPAHGAAGKQGV